MIDKNLYKESFVLFKNSFIISIIYTIIIRIISAFLFVPIFWYIFNQLIKTKGIDFIGNWEVLNFFMSFQGLIIILFGLFLIVILLAFEMGGIAIILNNYFINNKFNLKIFLKNIIISIKLILKKGVFKFLLFCGILLPLGTIIIAFVANIIFELIKYKTNNYEYMDFVYLFLGILIVFIIYNHYIKWLFSIHITFLNQKNFSTAIKDSKNIINKSNKKILLNFGIWLLIIILFEILVNMSLNAFVDIVIPTGELNNLQIFLSSLFTVLQFCSNTLFGLIFTSYIFAFISILYNKYINETNFHSLKSNIIKKNNYKIYIIVFVLVIIGILIGTIGVYYNINGEINNFDKKTFVVAHRGSSAVAPQNSISAIKQALLDNADIIEIDVQENKDGTIVLMHDENIKKVSGIDKKIREIDNNELGNIDIGSSFSDKYKGEKIPTLGEILDIGKGKTKFLIEIKEYGHGKKIVEAVNDLINEKCNPGDCLVHSLDPNILKKMKKLNPNIKLGLILASGIGDFYKLDFDFFSISSNMLTNDFITKAFSHKKGLRIWTLNNKEEIDDVIAMGVDGIITDYPILATENINYWNNLNDSEKFKLKMLKLINN